MQTEIVAPAEAHRSRWGYHPCDYATFLKLRQLHKAYQKALRQYHEWLRWSRKAPQNRVLRRAVRDEQRRRVGTEVVGPRPEPPLDPTFVRREMVKVTWHAGRYHKEGVEVERVTFGTAGVPESYRLARFPAATPGDVKAMPLSVQQIDALAKQREAAPAV